MALFGSLHQTRLDYPSEESRESNGNISKNASFSSSSVATETETGIFDVNLPSSKKTDDEFSGIIKQAQEAINYGTYPELIQAGSSGSYFVYDVTKKPIGVFKPKDEEPFAPLNPKWPKMFQRMLCFCCFGRACLIPNLGYLSETGASVVDEKLQLFIVPKTRVVKLYSPTFNYKHLWSSCEKKAKEGSFQLFVHDYRSAADVLSEWSTNNPLSEKEEEQFTLLFHKMCVLDYVIRNTDRHTDNWLIKYKPGEVLDVAVIDNGLAFPIKHPECASRFRQFPFNWAELPWAKKQLDPRLRLHLLNLLTPKFVSELGQDLKVLFRHDKEHNRLLTYSQIRVFRGQLWNLREALEANETPADWVKRQPFIATRRNRNAPDSEVFTDFFRKRSADCSQRACC